MKKSIAIKGKGSDKLSEALLSVGAFDIDEDSKIILDISDDFISINDRKIRKPIRIVELINEIIESSIPDKINIGEIEFLPKLRKMKIGNDEISLTEKEMKLLMFLYEQPFNKGSREQLLTSVWNMSLNVQTNTLETHVYRLRKKIANHTNTALIGNEGDSYYLIT